jgi:hypothetical protein
MLRYPFYPEVLRNTARTGRLVYDRCRGSNRLSLSVECYVVWFKPASEELQKVKKHRWFSLRDVVCSEAVTKSPDCLLLLETAGAARTATTAHSKSDPMACVSSARLMNVNSGYSNEELPPQPTAEPKAGETVLRTPSMHKKKRYAYDNQRHHHQQQQPPQYALPFLAAKSPISMSFATIIGAGKSVKVFYCSLGRWSASTDSTTVLSYRSKLTL